MRKEALAEVVWRVAIEVSDAFADQVNMQRRLVARGLALPSKARQVRSIAFVPELARKSKDVEKMQHAA